MEWKSPQFSKNQIIKAGKKLKAISSFDKSPEQNNFLLIVNNWRASHAYPLQIIYCYFKRNYTRPDYIIAQRLKRLPSIVDKLRREPNMTLWSMQDLGGCRIIVPTVDDVYSIVSAYSSSKIRHIRKKVNNYILTPKPSGYRSYHLIYEYQSDKKEIFNKNILIEIQIRTKLQHLWATAVETMSILTQKSLKSSSGDKEILRFFSLISSLFALKENMPLIPNTPNNPTDIIKEINLLEEKNHYLEILSAIPKIGRQKNKIVTHQKGYYLLILNYTTHQLEMDFFKSSELENAMKKYNSLEQLMPLRKLDTVLVSASSFKNLKSAYPNYFSDITDFIDVIKELLINPIHYFKERVDIMYYPVLRWKQGEQKALKNLDPSVKNKVTPIIEFPILGEPRPDKSKKETMPEAIDKQKISFQNRIKTFPKKLLENWGKDEIFLDFSSLLNQKNIIINVNDLDVLFSLKLCHITPVINPDLVSTDLILYLKQLFLSKKISALVFRVSLDTTSENSNLIDNIISQLQIDTSNCSIIYDLKDVSKAGISQCKRSFQSLYSEFNRNFKTTIMLSGALSLPPIFETDTNENFSRTDWLTWEKIRENVEFKTVQFGDYTISSANFVDLPFRGAPKIKYTLTNNWLVYKGTLGRTAINRNAIQYREMSKDLVAKTKLKTASCYGEDQILKCAKGTIDIGSPTVWVAIGINQHITFVTSQLNATPLVL